MYRKWITGAGALALLISVIPVSAEMPAINFDQGISAGQIKEFMKSLVADDSIFSAVPEPPARPRNKEWTVMVYVNAKNNLEKFGLKDVNEMEQVGSTGKVNVVVELGRIAGYDSSDGNWTGSRRYLIKKDTEPAKITSPILQALPKTDMGDWNHLVDFVNWARTNFPAKKYMLIVWNHGSGWTKLYAQSVPRGISYDDETHNHISTIDLGKALAKIGKIDVYGSDACLMQMASVVYQIKDYTDVVVGSEETEPGDGYTYNTFLQMLADKPAAGAEELGSFAVESYRAHYAAMNQGATQSAVRTSGMPALLTLVNDWTTLAMNSGDAAVLKTARGNAQNFYYSDNKDLFHFIQLVTAATSDEALRTKGTELLNFIQQKLIIANGAVGNTYKNAYGLAIYLPNSGYNANYDELAWAKDGNWDEFVKWLGVQKGLFE